MFIVKPNELRRQKDAYNAKFQRRLDLLNNSGVGAKPCRVKHPQQLYACSCTTMRNYLQSTLDAGEVSG
jgi:hypothetical protein